jgi:hypothetical protein
MDAGLRFLPKAGMVEGSGARLPFPGHHFYCPDESYLRET